MTDGCYSFCPWRHPEDTRLTIDCSGFQRSTIIHWRWYFNSKAYWRICSTRWYYFSFFWRWGGSFYRRSFWIVGWVFFIGSFLRWICYLVKTSLFIYYWSDWLDFINWLGINKFGMIYWMTVANALFYTKISQSNFLRTMFWFRVVSRMVLYFSVIMIGYFLGYSRWKICLGIWDCAFWRWFLESFRERLWFSLVQYSFRSNFLWILTSYFFKWFVLSETMMFYPIYSSSRAIRSNFEVC